MRSLGQELVGQRFGELTVEVQLPNERKHTVFLCRCACGKTVQVEGSALKTGHTRSCGCLRRYADMGRMRRLPRGVASFRTVVSAYRRNAARRDVPFSLTEVQCLTLFEANCHYCDCPPYSSCGNVARFGSFAYNGIDRIDPSLGYVTGNVVSCCPRCNVAKGRQTLDEFRRWIASVYSHWYTPEENA